MCIRDRMSRMCREKGAVKHDDRLDCLAQGVKYYTDALSISAYEAVKMRKQDDWQDILDSWMDDPQSAANHLVLGMDLEQRRQARGKDGRSKTPTWVYPTATVYRRRKGGPLSALRKMFYFVDHFLFLNT